MIERLTVVVLVLVMLTLVVCLAAMWQMWRMLRRDDHRPIDVRVVLPEVEPTGRRRGQSGDELAVARAASVARHPASSTGLAAVREPPPPPAGSAPPGPSVDGDGSAHGGYLPHFTAGT